VDIVASDADGRSELPERNTLMRVVLACGLLFGTQLIAAPAALAQSAPTITCDARKPDTEWLQQAPAKLDWSCGQSVMTLNTVLPTGEPDFDPLKSQFMNDGMTAAFLNNTLQGFRLWRPSGPPPRPEDSMMDLSAATPVEQGRWGETGELWWGRYEQGAPRCCRLNNRTVAAPKVEQPWWLVVGQETLARRYRANTDPKQYLGFLTGKITPWSDLSDKGSVRFVLESASLMRHVYGSANKWLRQEKVTVRDAQLELTLEKQLSGVLQLKVESGRGGETISLPVKRNIDETPSAPVQRFGGLTHFRITQGYVNAEGSIQKCRYDSDCFHTQPEQPDKHFTNDPKYRVRGMFFGADGQYLAILMEAALMQAGPGNLETDRGDHPGVFGVVVLKRVKP